MDQFEIMTQLDILSARLTTQMQSLLQSKADSLLNSKERILSFHPERSMDNLKQRLIFAQSRLKAIQANRLQQNQNKFHLAFEQLKHHNPESNIPLLTNQLNNLNHQLIQSMNNRMEDCHHQFSLLATTMDNLSPLKTLTRGYAAISKNKQIISSASQLKQNDIINIRFKDGETKAKVQ
jgi:exodeoxyribonuclease VII large subunit